VNKSVKIEERIMRDCLQSNKLLGS